ncbi:STAS domain-containing protein [Pelosinus sp. sgz500959]|uniref:STAS domain-containing protein n=1 Tax=Pelosinus sp. sgz500959 TaxID=3242472 RepID=UPI00366DAC72
MSEYKQELQQENSAGQAVFAKWLPELQKTVWCTRNILSNSENEIIGRQLIGALQNSLVGGEVNDRLKGVLERISQAGVHGGLTPTETAMYIFSLRPYLSSIYDNQTEMDMQVLLDKAGLYTFEVYSKSRDSIVHQQRQDLLELSTPVIKLMDGILVVPLIGTIDSKRTQQVMEKLLNTIVMNGAKVAILDITGVPTVDTLVANHIIKTATAVRLLGADLIITGISPIIAQTIVHIGVDLSGVITKAIMADGVALALEILNKKIVSC